MNRSQFASIPCRFYPNCKRGNSCFYHHPSPSIPDTSGAFVASSTRSSPATNSTSSSSGAQVNASSFAKSSSKKAPSKQAQGLVEEVEEQHAQGEELQQVDRQCCICFEESPSLYGLLAACNHLFCFSCVKTWRGQQSSSSLNKRTCPTCRTESLFFIPVSALKIIPFLQSGCRQQDKDVLIKEILDAKKKIPCKFINKVPPASNKCRFGADCHFSHLDSNGAEIAVRPTPRYRSRIRNNRPIFSPNSEVEFLEAMFMHLRYADGYAGLAGFDSIDEVFDHLIENNVDNFFEDSDYYEHYHDDDDFDDDDDDDSYEDEDSDVSDY